MIGSIYCVLHSRFQTVVSVKLWKKGISFFLFYTLKKKNHIPKKKKNLAENMQMNMTVQMNMTGKANFQMV